MTNFIVPIDFSVDSLKGLDWAVLFSQQQPVNIQLVYVLSRSTNFQPGTADQEHKYAQAEFEKLIKEYQEKLGNGSKIRYIIKKGKVYREIVNQVQSYKNGVISASTHGAAGFEELWTRGDAALGDDLVTFQEVVIYPAQKHAEFLGGKLFLQVFPNRGGLDVIFRAFSYLLEAR